ncbi:MAG: peptide deformylase [Pseudonocardia sp.]
MGSCTPCKPVSGDLFGDGPGPPTRYERGVARLVAHEIDHLHGLLYTDQMRAGVEPIPVEQYRGTGSTWKY